MGTNENLEPGSEESRSLVEKELSNLKNPGKELGKELDAETINFLSEELNRQNFAKMIVSGATKTDFLNIDQITPEIYRAIRERLNGHPIKGDRTRTLVARRGRSGGIYIFKNEAQDSNEKNHVDPKLPELKKEEQRLETNTNEALKLELHLEKHYYKHVQEWAQESGFDNCAITGGKLPGYKWENPDLIAIDYDVNRRSRSLSFEITSFEVKIKVEPYGCWQAAHYCAFSKRSYVVFAKEEGQVKSAYDGRVFDLAVQLGLGVLVFVEKDRAFKEIQSPRVHFPEPTRVEEAIQNFEGILSDILKKSSDEFNNCFKFRIA